MIIDTHLHVWSSDVSRYPVAEGRSLSSDGNVEFLSETMVDAGVDKAVIVQPIHYMYDNSYVADCLKEFPGKFAAIGLIDQKAPDAADQLERLVKEDGFSGLRIHSSSRVDSPSDWTTPDQDPIWRRAADLGASFVVHGPADNLPDLEPIIARFPDVPVALDHIGGAPTDEDPPYPVLSKVLNLAEYPNVYVKLTPQPHKSKMPYPHKDTFPTFQRLYDVYGPQRLMWGTNFPGVMRQTGYKPSLDMFREHMEFLTEADKELLFSKTALKLYSFGDS